MKKVKMKITTLETVKKKKTVTFNRYTQIPAWVCPAHMCLKCWWNFNEDPKITHVIAAEGSDGNIYYFHEECFG